MAAVIAVEDEGWAYRCENNLNVDFSCPMEVFVEGI